jgi:uncharacterized protein with beta-barrel porin domain
LLSGSVFATTILVTDNDGGTGGTATLNAALQNAVDGDTIDCSAIAGQTIFLSSALPAIGHSSTSSTPALTILGSGVIIDGGSTHAGLSLAQGSANISNLTIQNAVSRGAAGGAGFSGGGGATGGGGALYVHTGTTMTISAVNLNNNQAIGGAGGAGNATGGAAGGAGGYGGGAGGNATTAGASAGSGGGGGGNNGGSRGGNSGQVASPNTFTNFGGAGGGGSSPGVSGAKTGATNSSSPARFGGTAGSGTAANAAGAGGGAGSATSFAPLPSNNGNGFNGANAVDYATPGTGVGGAGGYGFGSNYTYGAGGGGGGGSGGGAGFGASGGGGGFNGPGGDGGSFGGGGGGSDTNIASTGGNGGFGAGGGGGRTGGTDTNGLGGAGGSATSLPAGGGGGSGLGGAIIVQDSASLIIQDGVSFSGNSTSAGSGGLAAGGGANGGNGSSLGQDIFIQSGGGLTFQINGTLTMSNPIHGAGSSSGSGVTQSGTGIIFLNGAHTYKGNTFIKSGTINLNGSVVGDIYIDAGGTLSGNATANGDIYSSGMISPGNSIGTINTTNLTLYSTSVYNVEVNSAGASDEIIATGTAQLGGSVFITPDDTNFTAPITYTIISAAGGVTGGFSSLTSSTPSLMKLIYNPMNVQLTYLPLSSVGLTGNNLNTASGFGAVSATPGTDAATISSVLFSLSFDAINSAFGQMDPAQFSGLTDVQLRDAILVRSTYTKHLQEFFFNRDRRCEESRSFWIDGIRQWQNQNRLFGYNDTTRGFTIGADRMVQDKVIGLAFSTTYDTFNLKNSGNKASINSYYGGVYSGWNHEKFYMTTSFISAYNQYKTARGMSFGTINRQAQSKHRGTQWLINFGAGYPVHRSTFQWTPYFNLDYVLQHENNYTEAGALSLDLHTQGKSSSLIQGEAGVLLSTTYHAGKGMLIPMLTLAYINQTPLYSKNYRANFVDAFYIFSNKGRHYGRNLFTPRFDLTYRSSCNKVNLSIYYDAKVGSQYWAQDVGLDLSFRF